MYQCQSFNQCLFKNMRPFIPPIMSFPHTAILEYYLLTLKIKFLLSPLMKKCPVAPPEDTLRSRFARISAPDSCSETCTSPTSLPRIFSASQYRGRKHTLQATLSPISLLPLKHFLSQLTGKVVLFSKASVSSPLKNVFKQFPPKNVS
jgi:hypothetical protein